MKVFSEIYLDYVWVGHTGIYNSADDINNTIFDHLMEEVLDKLSLLTNIPLSVNWYTEIPHKYFKSFVDENGESVFSIECRDKFNYIRLEYSTPECIIHLINKYILKPYGFMLASSKTCVTEFYYIFPRPCLVFINKDYKPSKELSKNLEKKLELLIPNFRSKLKML